MSDKQATEVPVAARTPLHETLTRMMQAESALRNSMGSFTWDHEFAQTKGYMQGYIAGLEKAIDYYEDEDK